MSELMPLPTLKFQKPLKPCAKRGAEGRLEWIEIDRLVIDRTYQRSVAWVGEANIRRVAEEFHWSLFSPLVVSAREGGQYAIIDGQHRAIAAKMHGAIDKLPCLVLRATPAEEARSFAVINGQTTKIAPQFLFRARLAAGDAEAIATNRVAEAAGVRILTYPVGRAQIKPNETLAASTIEQRLRLHGEAVVSAALKIIMKAAKGESGYLAMVWITTFCDVLGANQSWCFRVEEIANAVAKKGLHTLLFDAKRAAPLIGTPNSVRSRLLPLLTSTISSALGTEAQSKARAAPLRPQPKQGASRTVAAPAKSDFIKPLTREQLMRDKA